MAGKAGTMMRFGRWVVALGFSADAIAGDESTRSLSFRRYGWEGWAPRIASKSEGGVEGAGRLRLWRSGCNAALNAFHFASCEND